MKRTIAALALTAALAIPAAAHANTGSSMLANIAAYEHAPQSAIWVNVYNGSYLSGVCAHTFYFPGGSITRAGYQTYSISGGYWYTFGNLHWSITHTSYDGTTCDPRYYGGIYRIF